MQFILETTNDYTWLFLRLIAGIIIFPYGMQKLLGWNGGLGIRGTIKDLQQKRVHYIIAILVIAGQSLGSIALITGFLGRVAAAGNFIIFTGALFTHLPDGWMLNWFNKKKGEGIEYFVLLLAILLVIVIKGSGAWSIDRWLM